MYNCILNIIQLCIYYANIYIYKNLYVKMSTSCWPKFKYSKAKKLFSVNQSMSMPS